MSDGHMDAVVRRIAAAYPSVFSPDSGCWHDCPPGWEALVMELCSRLAAEHPTAHCVQCKRKFAALRFYLNEDASQQAVALAREYEVRSARTCERCGQSAAELRRRDGWLATLCAEHESETLDGA